MDRTFKHYTEYHGNWPWRFVSPKEIACRHCGELYIDHESMDALQDLIELWSKPIILNSAHRCVVHNKSVGGTENSQHLKVAFDCRCPKEDQAAFIAMAREAGFRGVGRYPGFVHLDMGPKREWRA